jgi:hypothetical protein
MSDPQSVLAALETKRKKVVEHYDKLSAERASISYSALAENSEAARRRLDQIAADAFKIDGELEAIDAAIKVAKERVVTARANEQRAEHAKLAAEAEANYEWLVKNGPKLSEHATALAALLAEAKRRIDANHALGFAFPTAMQFISAMTRATSALIMTLPLKNFEHEFLPPGQRFDYGQVLKGWGDTGLRNIEQQFPKTKEPADADAA